MTTTSSKVTGAQVLDTLNTRMDKLETAFGKLTEAVLSLHESQGKTHEAVLALMASHSQVEVASAPNPSEAKDTKGKRGRPAKGKTTPKTEAKATPTDEEKAAEAAAKAAAKLAATPPADNAKFVCSCGGWGLSDVFKAKHEARKHTVSDYKAS